MQRGMMTPKIVAARVEAIQAAKADTEVAHTLEDVLFQDVLQAIANGSCREPRVCAAEAVKALTIDFQRWCA